MMNETSLISTNQKMEGMLLGIHMAGNYINGGLCDTLNTTGANTPKMRLFCLGAGWGKIFFFRLGKFLAGNMIIWARALNFFCLNSLMGISLSRTFLAHQLIIGSLAHHGLEPKFSSAILYPGSHFLFVLLVFFIRFCMDFSLITILFCNVVSIIGLVIMATLFIHELRYYLTTYTVNQVSHL